MDHIWPDRWPTSVSVSAVKICQSITKAGKISLRTGIYYLMLSSLLFSNVMNWFQCPDKVQMTPPILTRKASLGLKCSVERYFIHRFPKGQRYWFTTEWSENGKKQTNSIIVSKYLQQSKELSAEKQNERNKIMLNSVTWTVHQTDYLGRVKRICVFEHSVMTNFNCACPAIQRGQGSGFLSEGSSWLTACMSEQRRFWRDCADAQARLNLRCSHRR